MSSLRTSLTCAIALLAVSAPASQAAVTTTDVFKAEGDDNWADYLVDVAPGPVSAAGILGIGGESVVVVENVRGATAAINGLLSEDSQESLGLSITPARTALAPMNLSSYADSWLMRLLGSLTVSYARAAGTLGSSDAERTAYAVDTNAFFARQDDPVLAFADSDCVKEILTREDSMPDGPPSVAPPTAAPAAAPGNTDDGAAVVPKTNTDAASVERIANRAKACRESTLAQLRWNRSQFSIAYGEGRVRPENGPSTSLGRTFVLGAVYGFDQFSALSRRYALSLSYRRSEDEPVLATLPLTQQTRKDSSVFLARLSGGSESYRLLAEVSDVRARDITASQRMFKRALGLDVRIAEGTWLNVRVGKQRRLDGAGNETGSLVNLSFSPKMLLAPR